jgi:Uma2 family endonuclease
MPGGERFELVNGQLLEKEMSALACWVTSVVSARLTNFVLEHQLGMVFSSEAQYKCFPDDERRIRKPDISFIQTNRMSEEMLQGFVPIAPDLAVEVVSENDTYYEVETKAREFLAAGVRLIWVLNPATSSVVVHQPGKPALILEKSDMISGGAVLPAFLLPVADFFVPPLVRKPAN